MTAPENRDTVMMSSNAEGIEKVEEADGGYAFLMESTSIEYIYRVTSSIYVLWQTNKFGSHLWHTCVAWSDITVIANGYKEEVQINSVKIII